MSVLPIIILQVYNQVETKSSLVKYSNQSLVNVTNRVFENLNEFIAGNLDVVRTEALLPALKAYLVDPDNPEKRKMARDTLISLSDKTTSTSYRTR